MQAADPVQGVDDVLINQEWLHRNVFEELIGDAGELNSEFLLQLRLHGSKDLQTIFAEEQIGGFGWKRIWF